MNSNFPSIDLRSEEERYRAICAEGLSLDMTRGKPSGDQLRMVTALGMDEQLRDSDYAATDGSDIRNYGHPLGLPETREFCAGLLGSEPGQTAVLGSSSLSLMYDVLSKALLFPLPGSTEPWDRKSGFKVLCPSPGYDRHFQLAAGLGAELVPVSMTADGPDMDQVEALVRDPAVKAMFCVPLYSNPQGYVYSEETCRRLASMEAAPDFRVIWDNAYAMHHLDWDNPSTIPEILALSANLGRPDRFFVFTSTSKMTYAGAGLAVIAAGPADFRWYTDIRKLQSIGPDKLNQKRHLLFFQRNGGVETVMRQHAAFLRPKFELLQSILDQDLAASGLAEWTRPKGGYFVSLDLQPGTARETVKLAREAGVAFTPAGSTFPNSLDPLDRNIRLAPTYPTLTDIEKAMKVLVSCVKLSAGRRRS